MEVKFIPESAEHKHIKETVRQFFSDVYGASVVEYPSSGFEIDVFSVTVSSTAMMVETIWTPSRANFFRDLTIVLSEAAEIKIVIVNPKILENPELVRYFEKIKISETRKGYTLIGMLGWDFSDEVSFLEDLKNKIDEVLEVKKKSTLQETEDLKGLLFSKEISLASIISMCLDLSKRLGFDERTEWLTCELYGYYDYIEKGKDTVESIDSLPGSPRYRRLLGKTTFYFGPGKTFEQDVPIIISQPIGEIESWIRKRSGSDFVIYMPIPRDFKELFRKHNIDTTQKLPIIVSRISLGRLIEMLKVEIHKFLEKLALKASE